MDPMQRAETVRVAFQGERGAYSELEERLQRKRALSKSAQVAMWKQLLGSWEDERTAKEIIEDIYAHRTEGRDVQL